MTAPKDGYEKEWFEAQEEIELLNEMIKDTEKEKTTVPLEQQFISKDLVLQALNIFDKVLFRNSGMTPEEWKKQSELMDQYLDKAGKPFSEFTYEEKEDFHKYLSDNLQSAYMQRESIQPV
jgi:hypothetical protein